MLKISLCSKNYIINFDRHMEELRKSGVIEDYSLTQTTLDEVKLDPLLIKQSVFQFNLFLGVCAVCKQTN